MQRMKEGLDAARMGREHPNRTFEPVQEVPRTLVISVARLHKRPDRQRRLLRRRQAIGADEDPERLAPGHPRTIAGHY